MKSSEYIDKARRDYSLYVLQMRAIPSVADGLKAAARRVLWTARDGELYKSATLSGRTMPLHPHAQPDGVINLLAAPYKNNISLLKGKGAFGTLLKPTAYGASRYTSAKLSQFTKDVVFKDVELVPLTENYDGTLMEPVHFLPLIPIVLLNPTEGIAIGFATNILPRALEDIIEVQILFLQGRKRVSAEMFPFFAPINDRALRKEETANGNVAFYFRGRAKKEGGSTAIVSSLPYGLSHEKFLEHLDTLREQDVISDYEDRSKDIIDVEVRFKRGQMSDDVYDQLKLVSKEVENLTVIGFDGKSVLTADPVELIRQFTEWRLGWYLKRYQRLHTELEEQIQKYRDILLAIKENVGSSARTVSTRADLLDYLGKLGIVHVEYIASFPVYRFTKEEKEKVQEKLKEAEELLKEYKNLIKSEDERKKVYISELREVLKQFQKGAYAQV